MRVIENKADQHTPATLQLALSFEARCKSRLRTRLVDGSEVGLFLPRGTILRGGDKLSANDGMIIEVIAAPERLMAVQTTDAQLLARAAYHLGNRHVTVHILPECLRFAADHVLATMLEGLGLTVVCVEAPFEPESGAYGAAPHTHKDGAVYASHSRARIHDHFQSP